MTYLNPDLFTLIMLSIGLGASICLFVQVKLELRRSEGNWRQEVEQVRFQLNEQRVNWIQSSRRQEAPPVMQFPLNAMPALEAPKALPPAAEAKKPAVWASSAKSTAVEMARRGEPASNISAAVSLPKAHVEFLIKLERAAALKS